MIEVVALRAFTWGDREVRPTELCHVSPVEAAALVYQGKAKYHTRVVEVEARTIEPDPPTRRASRRRYRRRDLAADA